MQDNVIEREAGTEAVPVASSSTVSGGQTDAQQRVAGEIEQLRNVLIESRTSAKRTKAEVRAIRERLRQAKRQLKQMRLFALASGRLRKKLTTPGMTYDFLRWYVGSFNLAHEAQANGILVLEPSAEAPEASPEATVPPAAGQAAAIADAGSGAVV